MCYNKTMVIDTTEYEKKNGKKPAAQTVGTWTFVCTTPYANNTVTVKGRSYSSAKKQLFRVKGEKYQCRLMA